MERETAISRLKLLEGRDLVCARLFEAQDEKRSILMNVSAFDLNNEADYEQVKKDYGEVRSCIATKGLNT